MKKMKNRMRKLHKTHVLLVTIFMMICLLTGCSLAKEGAGEEQKENKDRLIGAFITTESLNAFDMEAYLKDNIDELVEDKEVTVGNNSEYNGRIYATVDRHNSSEPSDWEVTFEGVEGICFMDVTWQYEDGEPFTMLTVGDEICDVIQHLNATDEGETKALTGTMYSLLEEGDEIVFYINPVYQTESGEIYVSSAMGDSITNNTGISLTVKLEEETTVTEDGESEIYGGAVELTIETVNSAPAKVRIHYMDNNLAILHTEEYAAGEVPVQIEVVDNTACIMVETEWGDGEVSREMYNLEEENSYIETFYKVSEISLGKKSTEVIWK